ncbi:hypothetical protein RDABS01_027989 [Bienertia sinuspersici]
MEATTLQLSDPRAGAEVVHDPEECQKRSLELLEEMGFPKGVLPLKNLVECGRVRETGFVWMKQSAPSEHYFEGSKTLTSYATEVTSYVEKGKMRKMTGVKSKQLLMWVTITEMRVDIPCSGKIHFKSVVGIGKSFAITDFMTEEEKVKYLESKKSGDDNDKK